MAAPPQRRRAAPPLCGLLLLLLLAASPQRHRGSVPPPRGWGLQPDRKAPKRGNSRVAMEQQALLEKPTLMAPSLGEECGQRIDLSTLDTEQREAYDAVLAGESVFITGGAGTGKTRTVRAIVEGLQGRYGEEFMNRVAVTGATGTAAVLLGGCTLHSATGVRVPEYVTDFKRVGRGLQGKIWGSMLEVLIIDEASMISGEFLDHLDAQLRKLRGDERAFGGLQVVLVGDVFQLPPITTQLQRGVVINATEDGRVWVPTPKGQSWKELFLNRGMLFQSDAFWDLALRTVTLQRPHRQENDEELADVLGRLRKEPDEEAVSKLGMASYRKGSKPPEDCVHLLPTRAQVDQMNAERLDRLPSLAESYLARDEVEVAASPPENATMEEEIKWAKGLQDLLLRSPLLGESAAAPRDLRLKPDALVMLVRTTEQEGGLVNGATGFVQRLTKRGVYVRFQGRDFDDFVGPIRFEGAVPGIGKVVREQIPLRLAWAVTHHRCQGKTIPMVSVDPVSFERGQAYVALSRSQSLETLHLQKPPRMEDFLVSRHSKIFAQLTEEGKSPEEVRQAVGHWRQSWPAHDSLVRFGNKHRGRTFEEVALGDKHYCRWVLGLEATDGQLKMFQLYLRRFWPNLGEDDDAPVDDSFGHETRLNVGKYAGQTFKQAASQSFYRSWVLRLDSPGYELRRFQRYLELHPRCEDKQQRKVPRRGGYGRVRGYTVEEAAKKEKLRDWALGLEAPRGPAKDLVELIRKQEAAKQEAAKKEAA